MTPVYLNPQTSSPIPFLELKGDQPHGFQVFGHVHDHDVASSSNNSCLSYTNSFNSHSSQETLSFDYSSHGGHSKVEKLVLSHEKSSDFVQPCSSWLQSTIEDNNNNGYNYGYSFHLQEEEKTIASEETNYDEDNKKSSKKWKPSKVRIMQKMMATPSNNKSSKNNNNNNNNKQQIDHQHIGKQQRQQNSSDGIRVCSDCHTTTTPLWRSGPQGPKSLCNACGIRQRKARRAAMAAAAAASFGNDTIVTPPMPSPPVEARKSASKTQEIKAERGFLDHQDKNHTLPIKKRSKIIDASKNNHTSQNSHNNNNDDTKKLCFEDFALSSNKDYLNPNPKRSFPRDEEEGAILLMALSCGLACSS